MLTRWTRRIAAGSPILVLLAATGIEAQLDRLDVNPRAGAAFPVGTLADYANVGANFGLTVAYPVADPLGVFVNGEVDMLNGNSAFGLPDMNLWRYQAGVQGELLGRGRDSWSLFGHVGAGGTTFRSKEFFLDTSPEMLTFEGTYFTGSAGLMLVFGSSETVQGYLGSRVHWSPIDETETQVLRDRTRGQLDSLTAALSVPVTLGLRIRVA